jgi:putative two-component system response regulator
MLRETNKITLLFLSQKSKPIEIAIDALCNADYCVTFASDAATALEHLVRTPTDLVITPIHLPDLKDEIVPEILWRCKPDQSILLLSEPEQLDVTTQLLHDGALDALIAPWMPQELLLRVRRTHELERLWHVAQTSQQTRTVEVAWRDEQLRKLAQGSMRSLIEVLEAKDPNTMHHSRRVATLAEALAKAIQPDDAAFQERVRVAAQFHDIGKVGVPDVLLRKTGKLMEVEWEFVRSYVDLSVVILRHLLDAETVSMVQTHAEHFDGNGYPIGLKAEEISLGGRIIAVADAYDAMTSPRAYREALTVSEVRQILRDGSGKQWDPTVVAAFLTETKTDVQ